MCFYPVDNTLSRDDPTVRSMLSVIEDRIEHSDYVREEKPLSWLKVLDRLTDCKVSFMPYTAVVELTRGCGVSAHELPLLLQFFHQMGILMWHADECLSDVVVLDPIAYFVTPATTVICKYLPTQHDPSYHIADVHEHCKLHLSYDFKKMVKQGVISEVLLRALLQEYSNKYSTILHLMIK